VFPFNSAFGKRVQNVIVGSVIEIVDSKLALDKMGLSEKAVLTTQRIFAKKEAQSSSPINFPFQKNTIPLLHHQGKVLLGDGELRVLLQGTTRIETCYRKHRIISPGLCLHCSMNSLSCAWAHYPKLVDCFWSCCFLGSRMLMWPLHDFLSPFSLSSIMTDMDVEAPAIDESLYSRQLYVF
jgi:hypothetical protein